MATFEFVARNQMGQIIQDRLEAENEQMVVRRLREQGLWPQKVMMTGGQPQPRQAPPRGGEIAPHRVGGLGALFLRVKGRDLSIFCRQFATMINAGVSLIRCLVVLEEQTASNSLRTILEDVQTAVESGESLSRSLGRFPRIFSPLFIGLVRAGEVGGVLDETLNRLATFLEEDQKLKRKVKAAMTYPALVMTFATGVVVGLVTFIIPRFIEVFHDLGVGDLPGPTQVLISFSNLLTHRWYILLGTVIFLVVAFINYTRTRTGKRHWDWVKLKMPVFGKLNHKIALARFARTLGTLLSSGVPILQAMETVAGALDNVMIGEAVMASRAAIREGERIGDPLDRSGYFPPMVVQMIAIGEETGSLDQMLSKIADFYESEVEATLQSLTQAMEPVMIVVLGFIVGFIVIAMFLPLINAIDHLSSNEGT